MKYLHLIVGLLIFLPGCELDDFLFDPSTVEQYQLPGNTIPDSLLEQVSFDSDGNTLYGYWVRAENPNRQMTILYCKGNKDNIDEYWDRVMMLHDLNVNLFIFDYRGFGRSSGESTELSMYKDGEVAYAFLQNHFNVNPDSLIFYGYSLGNLISIYLSSEVDSPLCLFVESAFASANSMTQSSLALDIPALWLTKGAFDNAEKIKHITTPVLVMHGNEDDFVRFKDNGKVLYENAPEPKSLLLVPKGNHSDLPEVLGKKQYLKVIQDWIDFSSR